MERQEIKRYKTAFLFSLVRTPGNPRADVGPSGSLSTAGLDEKHSKAAVYILDNSFFF